MRTRTPIITNAITDQPGRGSSEPWYSITNKSADTAEVRIFATIGQTWDGAGVSAKRFVDEFSALKAKKITVKINSPGGNMFEGFAIYNAIKEHPATVAVQVHGVAASIACLIAMAGDTISMAKNSFMMVHNAQGGDFGYACDLRKLADTLDKFSGTIAQAYADRSGKNVTVCQKWMNEETWFDSAEAKACGMCDSITEEDDDLEETNLAAAQSKNVAQVLMQFSKIPEQLKRIAACCLEAPPNPRPPTTETPMAAKITTRDGKQYVNLNGVEHEVEGAAPAAAAAANAAPKTYTQAEFDAARAAERAEGEKSAATYAANFDTVIKAAGLDEKAAVSFRNEFFGKVMDMAIIKICATNWITARATAVGEGNGGKEPEKKPGDDPFAKVKLEATNRFNGDAEIRRSFGVRTSSRDSSEYKAGLEEYVNRWIQVEKDATPKKKGEKSAEPAEAAAS